MATTAPSAKAKGGAAKKATTSDGPPVFADGLKLVEIGANLTDPVFDGLYHGKQAHPSDRTAMLERALSAGVTHIIITGGCLSESKHALSLTKTNPVSDLQCFSTVGVHPTRCNEFKHNPSAHMEKLLKLIQEGGDRVVAVGECGLDYDRLHFCEKETQLQFFELQFDLAAKTGLPMFLHDRNTGGDFARLMTKHRSRITGGVVHSFTGEVGELRELLAMDLYIGINGCSLKTPENLEAVRAIPLNRLLLETDAPWCEIRGSSAASGFVRSVWPTCKKEKFVEGMCVKSRQEPCHMRQVLEAVAAVRGEDEAVLANAVFENTMALFFPKRASKQ